MTPRVGRCYNLVYASGPSLALEQHYFAAFGPRDGPKGNSHWIIGSPDGTWGDSRTLVNQQNQRVLSAFL